MAAGGARSGLLERERRRYVVMVGGLGFGVGGTYREREVGRVLAMG